MPAASRLHVDAGARDHRCCNGCRAAVLQRARSCGGAAVERLSEAPRCCDAAVAGDPELRCGARCCVDASSAAAMELRQTLQCSGGDDLVGDRRFNAATTMISPVTYASMQRQ